MSFSGEKWRREAVVKLFRLITTTLLSLLLPLSFLLLSRLSSSSFLFSLIKSKPQNDSSFFFSIFDYTNPAILYVVVSLISIYTLVLGLTTKITAQDPNRSIPFYPHVSLAWLTLFLVQISVGLGLEGTVSNGLIIGSERNFLSRLVFFFGLHEVMLLWYRVIVKPVVDNTLLDGGGGRRDETVVERVALAVSCGTLWWWKLRDEVEALVGVAEAKRALLLLLLPINGGNNNNVNVDVGMVDFVNWWLYYMVVTIGMVRIVKGSLWFGMILLFEQGTSTNPRGISSASSTIPTSNNVHYDNEGDNKV